MDVAKGLVSLFLGCVPGAWIAFLLPTTPYYTRVALAIALSPFVLGALIVAMTALGLDFRTAAWIAAVLSAPSVWFFWAARPRTPPSLEWLAPAAAFMAAAGLLVLLWEVMPYSRTYSWHNMLQAEVAYQVTRLPHWPEEMGLAGVRLHYPWFGHIQVAAVGVIADVSPFKVYPVINVLTLLAFYLLTLEVVQRLTSGRLVPSAFLTMAGVLSPNFAGILMSYLAGADWAGEIRASTPLVKFIIFDLMTDGFALMAAVTLFSLASIKDRPWRNWAAALVSLTAVALTYPLLFLGAVAVACASLAAGPLVVLCTEQRLTIPRITFVHVLTLAAPTAIFVLFVRLLTGGESSIAVKLVTIPWQIRKALAIGLKEVALWLPLLLLAAWRLLRTPEAERLALFVTAAFFGALYVLVELPIADQYKFLLTAVLMALPLAAEQALRLIDWIRPAAAASAAWSSAAIGSLALIVVAPHIVLMHVPELAREGAPLDEAGFIVVLAGQIRLAWLNAVRERTPEDAVLVHPALPTAVTVFSQRSSYLACADFAAARPGYTLTVPQWLATVKGNPMTLLEHRRGVIEKAYRSAADDYADVDAELAALRRPIAIYLSWSSDYLAWLETRKAGRAIWSDHDAVVWLLDPSEESGLERTPDSISRSH